MGKLQLMVKKFHQILVNGRSLSLINIVEYAKNLPADLIKKIQVTTSKTDEEKK